MGSNNDRHSCLETHHYLLVHLQIQDIEFSHKMLGLPYIPVAQCLFLEVNWYKKQNSKTVVPILKHFVYWSFNEIGIQVLQEGMKQT